MFAINHSKHHCTECSSYAKAMPTVVWGNFLEKEVTGLHRQMDMEPWHKSQVQSLTLLGPHIFFDFCLFLQLNFVALFDFSKKKMRDY